VLILPESQRAFDFAAPLARKAGTVCVVSFPVEGFKISSQEVVFRDVRIRGIPWISLPRSSSPLRRLEPSVVFDAGSG